LNSYHAFELGTRSVQNPQIKKTKHFFESISLLCNTITKVRDIA